MNNTTTTTLLLLVLLVCTGVRAQNAIYFPHVKPESVNDLYVTPDEQTLVVKDANDVLIYDIPTGQRKRWYHLPSIPEPNPDQSGTFFYYRTAKITPLPNGFLAKQEEELPLLVTPFSENNRADEVAGDFRLYNHEEYRFKASSGDKVLGYAYDGRELWIDNSAGNYQVLYRFTPDGRREELIPHTDQMLLLGENKYVFYRQMSGRKGYFTHNLIDLTSGKHYTFDKREEFQKYVDGEWPRRAVYENCHPGYLRFPAEENKRGRTQKEDVYLNYRTGDVIPASEFQDPCPIDEHNGFRSGHYYWRTVRHTVTNESGTYPATLVEGYDLYSNNLVYAIQLTQAPDQLEAYTAAGLGGLEQAEDNRRERRRNAIAAAAGTEIWKGRAHLLALSPPATDKKRDIRYDLRQEHLAAGRLADHLRPGDEIFFPENAGVRTITRIDHTNNVLEFGTPDNSVEGQNAVLYYPLTEEVCQLTVLDMDLSMLHSCPSCVGTGKIVTGTRDKPGGKEGEVYFNGYTTDGRSIYSRKREQETIYSTCNRCSGSGQIPENGTKRAKTFTCFTEKHQ